jgi:hypothetical protein
VIDSARVKDDLVSLADFAYDRLLTRLAGLTDREYLWEPAPGCWSVRPGSDGRWHADGPQSRDTPGPLTTIAWRLSHLIDMLAADRNATWIGLEPLGAAAREADSGTAAGAIESLRHAYTQFRGYVAAADADALTDPIGRVGGPFAESTRAAFVLHELDELIHHGAEVGTMRDLYAALVS